MISKRARAVDASGIRKVFDLAGKLKNPLNLSIGQPDFDVPEEFREKAVSAIRSGKNKYTVTQGIPELREEIRNYLGSRSVEAEDVFITSGVSGGIVLALLAVTDPGDEILIPDPYFVMYKQLGTLFNLKVRFVDTYPDFKMTAERIEKSITKKTKLVFVNSPSNPTGSVLTDGELKEIAGVLKKYSAVAVFDEIYSPFDYEGKNGCLSKFYENTLLLSGFSKTHAMTGWRVGYAAGPKEIIEQMIKIQQYTFVCSPSMVQYGCLGATAPMNRDVLQAYKRKRDLVCSLLKDHFDVNKPEGAFYIFPKAPGGDGDAFVARAVENSVLIIPGSVFSEKKTHFRISFAAPEDVIRKGAEILKSLSR